ncbi:hypothetical protein FKP32DRAFT_1095916 [Trametes sanguinea]|nr:hypothetical protein FKP32DRAFT_1095916 [Trametes sanguinea]
MTSIPRNSASIVAILTTAAAEVILLVLTLVKTIGVKRRSLSTGMKTPLTDILLRNGSVHFLVLILGLVVESLSHRFMDARIPTSSLAFWLIMPYLNESFNAMILSRFILALRSDHFAAGSAEGAPSQMASPSLLNFQGFSPSTLNVASMPSEFLGPEGSSDRPESERIRICGDPFAAGFEAPPACVTVVDNEALSDP